VHNYFGDFDPVNVENLLTKSSGNIQLSEYEKKNFKQIKIDVLRT